MDYWKKNANIQLSLGTKLSVFVKQVHLGDVVNVAMTDFLLQKTGYHMQVLIPECINLTTFFQKN